MIETIALALILVPLLVGCLLIFAYHVQMVWEIHPSLAVGEVCVLLGLALLLAAMRS